MSLLLRLNLTVISIFVVVLLLGFFKVLYTTAEHIQHEVKSSADLTRNLIEAKINLLQTYPYIEVRPEKLKGLMRLEQFKQAKYLNIELFDSNNKRIDSNRENDQTTSFNIPERLKQLLIESVGPVDVAHLTIDIGNMHLGQVVINPDTDASLKDAWSESFLTITPVIGLFLLISFGMTIVVAFILKPVLEFVRTVNQNRQEKLPRSTNLSRLHHLLGLPDHLKDISHELQDSSQRVLDLNQKILHLQEEERRRLSAELHDELGQHITAIRFESAAIKSAKTLDATKQSAQAIDSISAQMKDIIRSMLERLHPPELTSMGLKGALNEIISSWQLRHPQVHVEFITETDFSFLDESEQISLYRIVQEGLTNISRHAGENVKSVKVSISADANGVRLHISDDGQGCDFEHTVKGFGLRGMQERVDGLSGHLKIKSNKGEGVRIYVDLPNKMSNQ